MIFLSQSACMKHILFLELKITLESRLINAGAPQAALLVYLSCACKWDKSTFHSRATTQHNGSEKYALNRMASVQSSHLSRRHSYRCSKYRLAKVRGFGLTSGDCRGRSVVTLGSSGAPLVIVCDGDACSCSHSRHWP